MTIDLNASHLTEKEINLLNNLPGMIMVCDKEQKFIAWNGAMGQLIGFGADEKYIGSTAYDMRCEANKCAPEMIEMDQYVLKNKKEATILSIHPYASCDVRILLVKKSPVFDKNNNIQGTIHLCNELSVHSIQQFLGNIFNLEKKYHHKNKSFFNKNFVLDPNYIKNNLTKTELNCLFYIMRGKTAREISMIFNRSPRTIEAHLGNIKEKLGCSTKSQLIEKSLSLGYLNIFPEELLKLNVSVILDSNPINL